MINGWVYKLFCEDAQEFYIGSTTDFHKRKISHKTDCNNKNSKQYNYKVYKFIREHNGYDNWEFEILEESEYEDKYCMKDREAYFIKTLKPSLNSQIPNRTDKDWYEDNKEKIIENSKKYYKDNKEHKKEYGKKYSKKYYKDNKGTIKEKAKEKAKVYYKNNKKHKKEKAKVYYQNNKNKISEYGKEKKLCEVCNCNVRRDGLSIHKKSQKHINNLNKIT